MKECIVPNMENNHLLRFLDSEKKLTKDYIRRELVNFIFFLN